MEDLQREAEELKHIERMVQEQFERAKQAEQEIDEQVNQWLKEAQKIGDIMKSNWLIDKKAKSSWMKRLFLSNHQAKKSKENIFNMINQVSALVARGKSILCVYFNTDTKGIELVWRGDFVEFESRRHVFKRIMDALKDEEDGIIGVFGMGGIGKTKLVVEIGKKAQDEELFSKVVMATVSQSPNIRHIQGMLADMAKLKLNQDTEIGRSNELRTQLGKQEKILVILDDVWEKIDIERIGIPKGCRIVLTTRREEVCRNMGCMSPICLDRITYEEAESLFKSYASTDRRPDLDKTVEEIVKECGGLPLAVVTVGSALRDKGLEEYKNAARKLSKSSFVEIETADRDIYACLKLSYDYLDDIETQKCFLLCSLYPEDTKIEVEGITSYAYGLCLFRNVESVDQARQKMIASVTKLENACLLSLVKDEDMFLHDCLDVCTVNYLSCVKMHDMVRDVALWIAKSDGLFLVPTSLKDCQRKDMYEKTTAVFLNSQDLDGNFPQELHCPNLKILILHGIRPTTLPVNFFRKASSLQVLDLEMETKRDTARQPGRSMPVSVQYLVDLKVLRVFGGSSRNDVSISIIHNLKSLEILELSFPRDEKVLPGWIGELCNLRVLNLSESYHLELIPCNLLPKLAQLEELYTPKYHQTTWSHTFLSDLRFLPRLSVFTGWFSRFMFAFPGQTARRHIYPGRPRILRLDEFDDESMKMLEPLWPGVAYLEIGMIFMKGIKSLCPHFDNSSFLNLRKLELFDSKSLECFIDTTTERGQGLRSAKVLPNLVELSLFRMKRLHRICNGPPPHLNFLGNLRRLWIVDCPRIENLFRDMLPVAPQLIELWIELCGALKSLYDPVQTTRIRQLQNLSCESDKQKLSNVGYGDTELHTMTLDAMLISLSHVDISDCSNLEEVFPSVSEINNQHCNWKLTNLIYLELSKLPKLECIWKVPQQNYCLLKLETVTLSRCDKLSSIFTPTLAQSLIKLKSLVIRKCAMLETIISPDEQDEPLKKRPHSSTSRTSFQELRFLKVESCHKLKTILPMMFAAKCLPKLELIEIVNCEALEEVFGTHEENKTDSQTQDVVIQHLRLELVDLPKLIPFSEFTWNQILSSLRTLIISGTTFKQATDIVLANGQEEMHNGMLPIRAARNLRKMEVNSECFFSSVEEVFDVQDAEQPILTGLRVLKLGNMAKVQRLWRGPAEFISLCNLEEIEVYNCPAIKSLFPHSFCWTLHSLETLKVYNCKELKNIFKPGDHEEHSLHGRCFPKLKRLYVSNCEVLESIFPVCVGQDFPCLKFHEVHDCPKLENININVLNQS